MSVSKYIQSVLELSGAKSLSELFRTTLGIRTLFDGNLLEAVYVHGPKTKLVGEDQFGNKYYENKDLPYDRSRWVMYGDKENYNPTSIPPEWHGWVNYINDYPPTTYNYRKPIYYVEPYITRTGSASFYQPKGAWANPEKRTWQKYTKWNPPS